MTEHNSSQYFLWSLIFAISYYTSTTYLLYIRTGCVIKITLLSFIDQDTHKIPSILHLPIYINFTGYSGMWRHFRVSYPPSMAPPTGVSSETNVLVQERIGLLSANYSIVSIAMETHV